MAPFIAEEASSAGATNAVYSIGWPSGPATVPTSAPIPMPMENR